MGILKPDTPKLPSPVEPVKEEKKEEIIKEDVSRKRGIAGTVNTSWQGLLKKNENILKRKTLLGE